MRALVLLLSSLTLAGPAAAEDVARVITTPELAAKMSGPASSWSFTLVDARTRPEYSESHIRGAVLVPAPLVARQLPAIAKDKARAIVFYCNGPNCTKTVKAAKAAAELGYKNVYEYKEGLPGWSKAGHRVEGHPLPKVEAPPIPAAELAASLGKPGAPYVVDIRDEEEFASFHIAQSKNIPLDDLPGRVKTIPAGKTIVIVDHSGHQASVAARVLGSLGRTALRRLDGGLLQWQTAGLPLALGR